MILSKEIEVKIGSKNRDHYRNLGYNCNVGELLMVEVNYLMTGSTIKIRVKCDICGEEKMLRYDSYLKNMSKYPIYCCNTSCAKVKEYKTKEDTYGDYKTYQINKMKDTNFERYGDWASRTDEKKEKQKMTLENNGGFTFQREGYQEHCRNVVIEKYGSWDIFQNHRTRNMRKDINEIKNYNDYKLEVYRLTRKVKTELFEKWNGYDFYDNEYIKNNFNLQHIDPNYPTIDHKISIYYGFKNNIDPIDISKIDNLCITKRYINSSKGNRDWTYKL